MASTWISLVYDTCELGVSSAVDPELLPPNQVAWGMNVSIRGGKPSTRPPLALRLLLPGGLFQGCEYFGVQGGMLVASFVGRLYRIRVDGRDFSYEEIPLGFVNSGIIRQVWMRQTVETLVIQDGQSNAILYDGSTATRSVYGKVPRGRQMAYGNGRLWVAVNANEAVAGDIRTGSPGSELFFTESTYLQGGGKLFFASGITGMEFIPVTGMADYGALLMFGRAAANAIRADITSRDDWARIPGFVSAILRSVGAASQWSIVSVNQDLYWRDSNGGIRSIRNALADEAGPGSAPISREVSRLTDYDSQRQLSLSSGVYFDNRLLETSSPYLLTNGGVAFKNLISLDFAPLSTMGQKSQAAYNGQWNGLSFLKVVGGDFDGKNRAFALAVDQEGNNQLWEFEQSGRADLFQGCDGTGDGTADGTGDGTADIFIEEYPTTCFIEYPQRDFGQPKRRKRLERCDLWLSEVNGELEVKVYWRPDNSIKWLLWDEASTCAKTTDAVTTAPHVWKNLLTQYRPQFKTFTIPDSIIDLVGYDARVGFDFQIRLVWTGRCKIDKVMLHATVLDDPDWADRTGFAEACVEYDVTGNEIAYQLPFGGCPFIDTSAAGLPCGGSDVFGTSDGEVIDKTYTITNVGGHILEIGTVAVTGDGFSVFAQPADTSLGHNESTTFTIRFTPGVLVGGQHYGVVVVPSSSPDSPCVFVAEATLNTFFFDQSDGPFVFPAWSLRDREEVAGNGTGGTSGDPAYGPAFFRQERISGSNKSKTTALALFPGIVACEMGAIGPFGTVVAGVFTSTFSGEYTFDDDFSGNGTGILEANSQLEGLAPGPRFFAPGSTRYTTAINTGTLIQNMESSGIPLCWERFEQEYYNDQAIFRYINWTDPKGWYVTAGAYIIWCTGYEFDSFYTLKIDINEMGYPVAREGEPARTQYITDYDAGTRTYTGNKSRLTISKQIGPTQTILTLDYSFTVTPDVGVPYTLYFHDEYAVTPGELKIIVINYPWVVNAEVYMELPIEFSNFGSYYDNFESYQQDEYLALPGVPTWNTVMNFMDPPPNADTWDDFEGYDAIAGQDINQLMLGYGWADAGEFNSTDDTNVYDDFEGYTAGDITLLNLGFGWVRTGWAIWVDEINAYDDMESYVAGSITLLTDLTSVYWNGDGVFIADNPVGAWDDFESYPVGAITVLDAVGGDWNGDGEFN